MSVRFRKSFKIFPGVKINIGKNSISTSVGVRGAHITFGKNGTYIGTGIPGTGLSQRTKLSGPVHEHSAEVSEPSVQTSDLTSQDRHYKLGVVFWLISGTLVLALLQLPQVLAIYWLLILGYVVVRAVRKKPKMPDGNPEGKK